MPSNLISINYRKYGHNQIFPNIFKLTARPIDALISATNIAVKQTTNIYNHDLEINFYSYTEDIGALNFPNSNLAFNNF